MTNLFKLRSEDGSANSRTKTRYASVDVEKDFLLMKTLTLLKTVL